MSFGGKTVRGREKGGNANEKGGKGKEKGGKGKEKEKMESKK
jgi:hypothetical protein